MIKKIRRYLILQLIPYVFWFVMGIGTCIVYLAATNYSCRLGEKSLDQLQIRALEEEAVRQLASVYGPTRPGSLRFDTVRTDWVRQRVEEPRTVELIVTGKGL